VKSGQRNIFNILKPGVSRKTQRIFAALIWSVVGIFLMLRGGGFLLQVQALWLAVVGVAIGCGKSIFMLDKSARKNIARIESLADGSCIGGVYSLKMWLLVGLMVALGITLRHSSAPREIVGVIYVAIGWALFFSSRLLWQNVLNR